MTYRNLPDPPFSTAEAAHVLGVHPDTVRNYILAGELKGAFRTGKLWKVPAQAVADFIERKRVA